jgi:DNA-binding LacI/PurR family transcriptional regulator
MEPRPKRTSLVDETARVLKEWVASGRLSGELPGELRLMELLGVGRNTLRQALQLLTAEGWLMSPAQGRPRHVEHGRLPAHAEAVRHLPVTFLSPYPVVQRLTVLEMEETRARLAEQGLALHFLSSGVFHLRHPQKRLERLVLENPSAAWVLHIASEPIQQWFDERDLPTLLFDSPFPGVKLPFVADDWEAAAFHAGLQLARHGHRMIGSLEYEERRPGLLSIERGLERALAAAAPGGRVVVFKDQMSAESVARSLDLAFSRKDRPTALVLTRAQQLLTCYSWLASRGIRVPGQVSLVSLADENWFEDFQPPTSYYLADVRRKGRHLADRVLELVTMGRVTKRSVRLPREYVPGATIGPAPTTSS